ncbi:MAG: MarR family winged helix-turn-helix transcriptional regulator [Candidatus Thermoplasmatota archaeon]|jgi:DNA-binding MarR family transcriptional regulator|nr:MarR family winged helix-turn-helix transcriptional regulator [Candidatus Thermoplasmatota archaeon]MCL5988883.1 MarR family winged helix-turn-helix transcriptional regulator [Candidatus Thermoplasmatota archaeon]
MNRDQSDEFMEIWTLISGVTKNVKRIIKQETNNFALKSFEIRILGILKDLGNAPINVIAEELDVSGAWITGVVAEMESRGYVMKKKSTNDKRIVMVSITQKGKKAVEEGNKLFRQILEKSLSDLSEEELSQMKRILEKINHSSEEMSAGWNAIPQTFNKLKTIKK